MEFLDEYESRPRFLFQSKNTHQPSASEHHPQSSSSSSSSTASFFSSLHKPTLFLSISISLLLSTLAFLYANFEPLKSLLFWLSLSLLLGPFAPPSLTAGDIRVGIGPPLNDESLDNPIESNEKLPRKSTKARKKVQEDAEGLGFSTSNDGWLVDSAAGTTNRSQELVNGKRSQDKLQEEGEWVEADDELLRKLMGKHPVGKPGRWESIAEGYKGKFKVDTVISKAKEMGERKVSDQDSYKKFLKDRKPVDKRAVDDGDDEGNAEIGSVNQNVEAGKKESEWSSVEDLALLNALKAFPKDAAMRWDKIAASVPGKTKAACMKRVTELKKGFRTSKASSGQAS